MEGIPTGDAYERWAASYDTDVNRTRDLAADVLRGSALSLAGRDVLEVGCGTGRNTEWLASHARSVTGVDLSPAMLSRARIAAPQASFVQHDLRNPWPLPDDSFDLVIDMLVMEHIERLPPLFDEAARVMRSGGELFVCEYHPERQRLGRQARFADPTTGEVVRVEAYLHETAEYVNAAREAGFRLLRETASRSPADAPDAPPRLLSLHLILS